MDDQEAPLAAAFSDDLTGAIGLSMVIAAENIPVRVVTALPENYDPAADAGRVVVINTETRSLSVQGAWDAVCVAARRFPSNTIIAKRFDTTLRGHLGTELAAVMALRPQAAAIVVPAFPGTGRLCIGGFQLMHGIPIERTETARDIRWPVSGSYVPDYFIAAARNGAVDLVSLRDIDTDLETLTRELRNLAVPGAVVVIDACDDRDIATISQAVIQTNREVVLVSPGAFIGNFLGRLLPGHRPKKMVLAVNGSTTGQTRRQFAALERKHAVRHLKLHLSGLTADGVHRLMEDFLASWNEHTVDVLLVRLETRYGEPEPQSHRVLQALCQTTQAIVKALDSEIGGLILTGGETASRVLATLGTTSIEPVIELEPLIVGGIILDGTLVGRRIVTKGGLVGDESIFLKALSWFMKENN